MHGVDLLGLLTAEPLTFFMLPAVPVSVVKARKFLQSITIGPLLRPLVLCALTAFVCALYLVASENFVVSAGAQARVANSCGSLPNYRSLYSGFICISVFFMFAAYFFGVTSIMGQPTAVYSNVDY
jgi:hypothetical protein